MSTIRILVIDDNQAIHQDFIKILNTVTNQPSVSDLKLGKLESLIFGEESKHTLQHDLLPVFEIDTALQGKEGLEKIAASIRNNNPYSIAFVDIRMPPGWDGVETTKRIWELDENIQVVICTAFSDYSWEETVEKLGTRDNLLILKKPFDNIAVRQLACALSKKWQLMNESRLYTRNLEKTVDKTTLELEHSLSQMRATFNSSAEGIIVTDNKGNVIDYNDKLKQLFSLPDNHLHGVPFTKLIDHLTQHAIQGSQFAEQAKQCIHHHNTWNGQLSLINKSMYECYSEPYTIDNQIVGRVFSFLDITKPARLNEQLQHQATHDLLTDLPNRLQLTSYLKKAIETVDNTAEQLAVIFLDLDRFKLINDSLSHEAGDFILKAVSQRLKQAIRSTDLLCRLGGDEFVIVTKDFNTEAELNHFLNRILDAFKQPFRIENHDIQLTTSMGVSIYPRNGHTIDLLLRNADSAMYLAKSSGANQYQYFTEELNTRNIEKLEREADLRSALLNHEFELYYQPQIEITTEKLVSLEALIRWNHPRKGLLLPIDFIAVAEESNLIEEIGEWTLYTACKQLKQWMDEGIDPIRIAVNISPKQARQFNFSARIKRILDETGLDPNYLELELTENVIINNPNVVMTIAELKDLGIQIALDDFGTGYASLNFLRHIPVDKLKIDQSFIKHITNKTTDDAIVQAIISIAKSLNLEVIAEGVESSAQVEHLKKLNCEEVQGYFYQKPMTADECREFLETNALEKSTIAR